MFKDYPIIDLHTHLRNNIPGHTKVAQESGIDVVVYMANSRPPLDNLEEIKKSLQEKRYCQAIPIAAITKGLRGRELVEVEEIKPYVIGFSDDGQCVHDLNLIREILKKNVLVLVHCEPEVEMLDQYLSLLSKIGGKLHIQHVSRKESVGLIREAKKSGIKVTCETCPHYFTYTKDNLAIKVNPPLNEKEDVLSVKEGLSDGTIDVIASDYAPPPRKSGVADFKSFLPLSYKLVLRRVLSEEQLKEKLYLNPQKIIQNSGYKLEI